MVRFETMIVGLTTAAMLAGGAAYAADGANGDETSQSSGVCAADDYGGSVGVLSRALSMAMPGMPGMGAPAPAPAPAPGKNCPGADKKLPPSVVKWLGSKMMRQHHYLWHLVRTNWNKMPKAAQAKLLKQGWTPPRQQGEPGSGMDFICMHHNMIKEVNAHLKTAGDACYKEVEGFDPIPFDPKDPNYPMPSDNGTGDSAKSQAESDRYKKLVDTKYSQDAWLKNLKSVDALGLEFEEGIHGWMHMHWATEDGPADPMKCGATNAGGCDWLGTPFTAHVNPIFWKLHGWIEARAQRWAELHNTDLDTACKDAFTGPKGMGPMMSGSREMPGMDGMDMPMPHEGAPNGGMTGMGNDADFNDVVKTLPKSMKKGLTFKF